MSRSQATPTELDMQSIGDGEARYRAVVDALAEGIVLQDRDGTIIASNQSAERILQMSADELHGRTSLDPEWRAIRENGEPFPGHEHPAMLTLRTGEAKTNVVMGVRRGQDKPTWISINTRPLFREGATQPHAVVCSFFDITDAKELERSLRVSEERFRSLFEYSMDGVLLTNPSGSILAANPAACRMLAATEAEILAGGRARVVDVTDPRVQAAVEERSRTGRFSGELTFLRADGSRFPAEVTSVIFLDGNGEQRTSMLFRDVSERQRLDQMKSEFVSTVSHELRTPLTSIRGVLGLLGGGVLGALPATALEQVRMATANADRLSRLLDDILDFERLEARALWLQKRFVEPGSLLQSALDLARSLADAGGVELRMSVFTRARVSVDPERISQVLLNLLSNAIKFSGRGASVDLVVRQPNPDRIRFEVTDRGQGIAAADASRLFTRFHQIDASDSRERGGPGLGLAIAKAIVIAHAGEIGVDSGVGVGSTFWFELPLPAAGDP